MTLDNNLPPAGMPQPDAAFADEAKRLDVVDSFESNGLVVDLTMAKAALTA
jgi:hypothetical protein